LDSQTVEEEVNYEYLKENQLFKAEGLKGVKCYPPTMSESRTNIGKILVIHSQSKGKNYENITFEKCISCAKCLPKSWIERLSKMQGDIKDGQYGLMSVLYCMRKTYFQRTKPYYETLAMLLSREKGRNWQNTRKREGGTWSEMEFNSDYYDKFDIPIYKVVDGKIDWENEENILRYEKVNLITFIDHYDPYEAIFIEGKKLKKIPTNKHGTPNPYQEHYRQIGMSLWLMKNRLKVKKIELIYHSRDDLCRFDISRAVKNHDFFLNIEEWIYDRVVRLHNFIRARIIPQKEETFLCRKCIFIRDCTDVERKKVYA
jgi:hypothetical protein